MKIHEHQNLVRFQTKDGFGITGLLVTKEYKKKEEISDTPILLQIHGLLGHFLSRGTPRLLPHALLEHGFSSFSINTRLAFAGQMNGKGVFEDTIYDIDAAVEFLNQEGFKNIYILGYSLGAAMLVNWAANREHKNVKGIILESCHYSLVDWWKRCFNKWGSSPTYDEVYEKAKEVLGEDPYNSPNDELFTVYQSRGPNRTPASSEIFTYKTWWFMAGPEADSVVAHKHVDKIKIPILFLRGENDPDIVEEEPYKLAEIAQKGGNKHVKVSQLQDADHDCMKNPDQMMQEIVDMLVKFSKNSEKGD
ncbi:alpha/beta hydrolase family protein [Candidatus Omnitrophota bacterium]